MKYILQTILIILIIFLAYYFLSNYYVIERNKTENLIISSLEKAYFEGQKDALNGDTRIKINKDSTYTWIKSPWDDNTKPIFTP